MEDLNKNIEILERALQRERSARAEAEHLLEKKSLELFSANKRTDDLNIGLEKLVEQRTRAVTLAHEHVLAASKAKSRFLAAMSHEIRTPLNVIIGYCDYLVEISHEKQFDEETVTIMHNIEQSGHLLLNLISEILDLSKIESGKLEVVENVFSFEGFIDGIASIAHSLAAQKSIDLKISLSEGLPKELFFDEMRLKQVIVNLIGNAIKFTPSGKSVVLNIYEQQGELIFLIKDQGPGISDEDQIKIFEPFEQVSIGLGSAHQTPGIGLGLAIARELISLLKGRMWVDSKLGEGSSFFVAIKLVKNLPST